MTSIYKKGSIEDCGNYRPISLLCVAYKVLAAILLRRLQDAGAEDKLTSTQFGFRRGQGTIDAKCMVRRKMEYAWATKHGSMSFLALDLKMAFDYIDPAALIRGLRRFGLPGQYLELVRNIYAGRSFRVRDGDSCSEEHHQFAGISQGCPLSPFLFVMLMTILMHDASLELPHEDQELLQKGCLASMLYADDTLLMGVSPDSLQGFLKAISKIMVKE